MKKELTFFQKKKKKADQDLKIQPGNSNCF